MDLFYEYEKAMIMKKQVDASLDELKGMILDMYEDQVKTIGSKTINEGPYKMTITKKMTVKVDQQLASVVGVGFKKEYKFSRTDYKKLSESDQKRVDECLTEKPAKPSFKFERVGE